MTLNLNDNELMDKLFPRLVEAIGDLPALQQLYLAGNALGDLGTIVLAPHLK